MKRRMAIVLILAISFLLPLCAESRTSMPNGVDITYSLAPILTLHQPVPLVFTIANKASQSIHVDLGQDKKGSFLFTLTRPDGVRIKLPGCRHEGISQLGPLTLLPGQNFSETILIDEWYKFEEPGRYQLQARLAKPILVEPYLCPILDPGVKREFPIEPRSAERLEAAAKELSDRIENSTSYADAAQAALALSYIADPVAVPYLEKALRAGKLVEPNAVTGLERIANKAAIDALVSGLQVRTADVPTLIRAALQRIQRQTSDPQLQQEIDRALHTGTSHNR